MFAEILDCTLRDGSYEVNFGMDAALTSKTVSELDSCDIKLIEVGHGIGIDASEVITPAKETDYGYAKAAQAAIRNSNWGMFCIPTIATSQSVIGLADEGMGFVRIGIDVGQMEEGLRFIEAIQDLDLKVFVNFMKSYSMNEKELATRAKLINDNFPIEAFYLVDSAGGMLPQDVKRYGSSLRGELGNNVRLGFHGHNNLGMAVSNSLACLEEGFSIVDSTLQGIGRSAGNAPTERIAAVMALTGHNDSYDVVKIMKISESVRRILGYPGTSGLDTMAGLTGFHSSYMDNLLEISKEMRVDPYRLMREVTQESKSHVSDGMLRRLAKELPVEVDYIEFPPDYFQPGDQ